MVLSEDRDCLSEACVNSSEASDGPSKAYDCPFEACDFNLILIVVTVRREEGLELLQPSPRRNLLSKRICKTTT